MMPAVRLRDSLLLPESPGACGTSQTTSIVNPQKQSCGLAMGVEGDFGDKANCMPQFADLMNTKSCFIFA